MITDRRFPPSSRGATVGGMSAAEVTDVPLEGLPPQEDYVDGPSTTALAGAVIEYRYTRGTRYRLTFDHDGGVTFAMLDVGPGGPPAPLLPYRARELRPGLFLVHWIVKQPGIHVTLTIDLTESTLHSAAMMPPNRWEFWDAAVIESVTRT